MKLISMSEIPHSILTLSENRGYSHNLKFDIA